MRPAEVGAAQAQDAAATADVEQVVVTGLMKQSDVVQPGVGLAGGKVRITPVMPNTNGRSPAVDPGPQPPILDVESYRLLNASCPNR